MFPQQVRIHPLKYLYGLAAACQKRGVKIYVGRRVTNVAGAEPKKNKPCEAQLDGGQITIQADAIIVATNTPAPINDWMGIYLKQASYRTYCIAMRVPHGTVADALYWDNLDPYHYVRLTFDATREDNLLIVGGEDHKVGQSPEPLRPFENLAEFGAKNSPTPGRSSRNGPGRSRSPRITSPTLAGPPPAAKTSSSPPATAAWVSPTAAWRRSS